MTKITGVRFREAGKIYYFDPKDLEIRNGSHVIVETTRGVEYGTVVGNIREVPDEKVPQPLRAIIRVATKEDEDHVAQNRAREKEAMVICREKIAKRGLEMKLIDAEYTFDNSKILFYFTADGRVDFRELVKDLAYVFRTRIELRQIGVRDETKLLGGFGICGRELCCATFLKDFVPVSIRMAKEQNLSLNPAKISGVCGRLMCCLKYEEDAYEYLNSRMPMMNEEVTTAEGRTGKVNELDVLGQKVKVLFEDGEDREVIEYPVEELTFAPRTKRKGDKKNSQKNQNRENHGSRGPKDTSDKEKEFSAGQEPDNAGDHTEMAGSAESDEEPDNGSQAPDTGETDPGAAQNAEMNESRAAADQSSQADGGEDTELSKKAGPDAGADGEPASDKTEGTGRRTEGYRERRESRSSGNRRDIKDRRERNRTGENQDQNRRRRGQNRQNQPGGVQDQKNSRGQNQGQRARAPRQDNLQKTDLASALRASGSGAAPGRNSALDISGSPGSKEGRGNTGKRNNRNSFFRKGGNSQRNTGRGEKPHGSDQT